MNQLTRLLFLCVCFLFSCKEEYHPPLVATDKAFLVVEGFLNMGAGPTNIRLSQTTKLSEDLQVKPLDGAQLVVEGKDNSVRTLMNQAPGTYHAPSLGIKAGMQYRLLITLPDGRKYRSEYVMAKDTPPIDSITWQRNEKGVEVQVSAHDASNSTRYYRWEYEETWEIRSRYFAAYKYVAPRVVARDPVNENIYNCWRSQSSPSVLTGSTTQLDADVVARKPLLLIPNASEKLSVRYSILVKQYAIDQKGYEFFQAMKKNTESLGSIFDAQPSEVRGNIQSVSDPADIVIGYITASSVMEKRIFISNSQVQDWGYSMNCVTFEVANNPDSFKKYYPGLMPYEAHGDGPSIVGYYSADPACVDCTLRGTNIKPLFW